MGAAGPPQDHTWTYLSVSLPKDAWVPSSGRHHRQGCSDVRTCWYPGRPSPWGTCLQVEWLGHWVCGCMDTSHVPSLPSDRHVVLMVASLCPFGPGPRLVPSLLDILPLPACVRPCDLFSRWHRSCAF